MSGELTPRTGRSALLGSAAALVGMPERALHRLHRQSPEVGALVAAAGRPGRRRPTGAGKPCTSTTTDCSVSTTAAVFTLLRAPHVRDAAEDAVSVPRVRPAGFCRLRRRVVHRRLVSLALPKFSCSVHGHCQAGPEECGGGNRPVRAGRSTAGRRETAPRRRSRFGARSR